MPYVSLVHSWARRFDAVHVMVVIFFAFDIRDCLYSCAKQLFNTALQLHYLLTTFCHPLCLRSMCMYSRHIRPAKPARLTALHMEKIFAERRAKEHRQHTHGNSGSGSGSGSGGGINGKKILNLPRLFTRPRATRPVEDEGGDTRSCSTVSETKGSLGYICCQENSSPASVRVFG